MKETFAVKILSTMWISVVVGCGVAVVILWMVRRNRMIASHSLWWLSVAGGCLIFGFFPRLIDWIALRVGVYYPPTFLVMMVIAMLLIKVLTMDMDMADKEYRIRTMAQRMAILEHEIEKQAQRSSTIISGSELSGESNGKP